MLELHSQEIMKHEEREEKRGLELGNEKEKELG